MPDGLINGLYIVPILAVLIIVHEFGHFFAAKAVGANVEEFGIGIPPRLKGWDWKGVTWSLNWIPFGGFVKVQGEDGKDLSPGSMNSKTPAQRAFFLAAGSGMNVLLAVVLIILVTAFQGVTSTNVYVGEVTADSPAQAAGLVAGDEIIEVGGVPIDSASKVQALTKEFAGKPLSFIVDRDGEVVELFITPRVNPPAGQGHAGISSRPELVADIVVTGVTADSPAAAAGIVVGDQFVSVNGVPVTDGFLFQEELMRYQGQTASVEVLRNGAPQVVELAVPTVGSDQDVFTLSGIQAQLHPVFTKIPAGQVIPYGLREAWTQITAMLGGLRDLVTGKASLSQIAGPVGMGQIASQVIGESPLPLWVTLSQLAILLSLNLAILNLLPLPALDGGRLLFVFIEVLRGGKKVPPEREGMVHLAGMVILLGVMFVVTFLDLGRVFGGGSAFP